MKRVKFRDRKQGKKHIKKRKHETFSKSLDALHSITPAALSVKERDHFQKTLKIRVATKRSTVCMLTCSASFYCRTWLYWKQSRQNRNTAGHQVFLTVRLHPFSIQISLYLNKPFFLGFSPSGVSPRITASKLRSASFCASFMRSGTWTTRVT